LDGADSLPDKKAGVPNLLFTFILTSSVAAEAGVTKAPAINDAAIPIATHFFFLIIIPPFSFFS
jgi:hypothetical protein